MITSANWNGSFEIRIGRWMAKQKGAKYVQQVCTVLCPPLDCCWNASNRMIQQQRKRLFHGESKADVSEDTSRYVETTIPWLLVYLLHVSLMKSSHKQTASS